MSNGRKREYQCGHCGMSLPGKGCDLSKCRLVYECFINFISAIGFPCIFVIDILFIYLSFDTESFCINKVAMAKHKLKNHKDLPEQLCPVCGKGFVTAEQGLG